MVASRASRLGWFAVLLLGQQHGWASAQSEDATTYINRILDAYDRAAMIKEYVGPAREQKRLRRANKGIAVLQSRSGFGYMRTCWITCHHQDAKVLGAHV